MGSSAWAGFACAGPGTSCRADTGSAEEPPQRAAQRCSARPRDSSCCGVSKMDEWCPVDYDDDEAGEMILVDSHSALPVSLQPSSQDPASANLRLLRRAQDARSTGQLIMRRPQVRQPFQPSTEVD